MKPETMLAQAGSRWDQRTGAVTMPIYQTATFRHPALGESTGFDYTRTANPTRSVVEETIAALEGGIRASAFGSGIATNPTASTGSRAASIGDPGASIRPPTPIASSAATRAGRFRARARSYSRKTG